MKQIIYSLCVGSLALAFTAQGQEIKTKPVRKASTVQKTTTSQAGSPVHMQHAVTHTGFRQQSHKVPSQVSSGGTVQNSNRIHARQVRSVNSAQTVRNHPTQTNMLVNHGKSVTVDRQKTVTVNNNWRNGHFAGQQYAAFRNYHRQWHDRDWWRSHYSRIIFVSGGWYAWNGGYWYPAWGYDRGYYYPYDGPIYGYNDLTPDRVVVNVQAQLQRDGYYAGPVDGVLGPMTREAISAFQSDHGLAVTSAVDEPTLATLGLV